ncbi:hypothetical protein CSC3H3_23160 (plasmid) [Thalassospira marina]|uniref:Carrier domain-containing protein n=2 Tax=Thalassospira marina TaxID=2048283 RepID=A0ABN5FN90_9PROT|nr:hypothetical protein CSC3H3_23160 [Thalassospira marina]
MMTTMMSEVMTRSVLESIHETAIAQDHLIAIEDGDRKLTYGQLWTCMCLLGRQGLTTPHPGLIAICGRPSIETALGILAAFLSGDVAVPIDDRLPLSRREELAQWCDISYDKEEIVRITCDVAASPSMTCPPLSKIKREKRRPAYVAFTSGTTGVPKAIEGTMTGLDHFIAWQSRLIGQWVQNPRVSWLTPLSFDVMYRDLLLPLNNRGTLVIPDSQQDFNIAAAWNWLNDQKIDIAHVVPSIVGTWLNGRHSGPLSVKALFFAGEPLRQALISRLKENYVNRIYNLYGPSESTMAKFCRLIDDKCTPTDSLYPVGMPIDHDVSYVLSKDQEIIIRSAYLTNGYRQKDGTVAPFPSTSENCPEYHTGDRGRVIDGELYVLGRLDSQLKINGIRIEASEIESLAERYPGIRRTAAVKLAPPDSTVEIIVLFYQGDLERKDKMRKLLAEHLHPAVVPTAYLPIADFPLTLNGKIDRQKLKERAATEHLMDDPSSIKGTGTEECDNFEQRVQEIMSSILRYPCRLDTDFLDIGGNSLMFGLITLELHSTFGLTMPQQEFYNSGTPRSVAAWLRQNGASVKVSASAPSEPTPTSNRSATGPWPLTPRQQTIHDIFHNELFGSGMNMILQVPVAADQMERVKAVVSQIVAQNDCFHLNFRYRHGKLYQYLSPPDFRINDIDVIEAPCVDHDRLSAEFATRPFDLAEEKPFRVRLLKDSAGTGRLLFLMYHLISDGMSQEYLRRDILDGISGNPIPLRNHYSPSLQSEQRALSDRILPFWKEHLDGAMPTARFISPQHITNVSARCMTVALASDYDRLMGHLRTLNSSIFPYLLSHFYRALAKHAAKADLIIRVTTHGRDKPELADVMGCIFSAVPVRLNCAGWPTKQIVDYINNHLDTARMYQDLCFQKLAQALGEKQDIHLHPLTGISFTLDGFDITENMPASQSKSPQIETMNAKLPHELRAIARPYRNGCILKFVYRAKAFTDEDILAISSAMQGAIAGELQR